MAHRTQDFGQSGQNKKDSIELEGKVIEQLPNALFRVQLDSGQIVLGHLAGKMRVNMIRVLNGDKVLIEMTPYDLTKGRITRRMR
ncbi:MAG: translation initiation factor IF-1 [Candidatus Doudnabacteria bacterium]|nr:translation initiation factor IF-1 [Candidatus Doudnabacteria bacterium]